MERGACPVHRGLPTVSVLGVCAVLRSCAARSLPTFEADTQMTGVNDRSDAGHAGSIPSTSRLSGLSHTARSGFLRNDLSLSRTFVPRHQQRKPRRASAGAECGVAGGVNSVRSRVVRLASLVSTKYYSNKNRIAKQTAFSNCIAAFPRRKNARALHPHLPRSK